MIENGTVESIQVYHNSYVAMYKWKTMKANICTYISRHIIV